jgi:hypothetical protein
LFDAHWLARVHAIPFLRRHVPLPLHVQFVVIAVQVLPLVQAPAGTVSSTLSARFAHTPTWPDRPQSRHVPHAAAQHTMLPAGPTQLPETHWVPRVQLPPRPFAAIVTTLDVLGTPAVNTVSSAGTMP